MSGEFKERRQQSKEHWDKTIYFSYDLFQNQLLLSYRYNIWPTILEVRNAHYRQESTNYFRIPLASNWFKCHRDSSKYLDHNSSQVSNMYRRYFWKCQRGLSKFNVIDMYQQLPLTSFYKNSNRDSS